MNEGKYQWNLSYLNILNLVIDSIFFIDNQETPKGDNSIAL